MSPPCTRRFTVALFVFHVLCCRYVLLAGEAQVGGSMAVRGASLNLTRGTMRAARLEVAFDTRLAGNASVGGGLVVEARSHHRTRHSILLLRKCDRASIRNCADFFFEPAFRVNLSREC